MLQFNEKMRQMAGMRVYIDTNILIYFFNKDPRYFSLVSSFLQQCADRKILGTVSQLVVAEVLVLPYRDKNLEAVAQLKAFFGQKDFLHVSEHGAGFMEESAMLAGERGLKLMDAMHWHAAVTNRCDFFVTNDLGFKSAGAMEVVQLAEFV